MAGNVKGAVISVKIVNFDVLKINSLSDRRKIKPSPFDFRFV